LEGKQKMATNKKPATPENKKSANAAPSGLWKHGIPLNGITTA
jgi:hypothetical protein